MPDGSNTPAAQLAGAEAAQAAQAARLALERAAEEAAAGQTHERSQEEASGPVQGTRAVEGSTIQGDTRGARSFTLVRKAEGKKKEETPPPGETPADPQGRGATLDVKA